jgi:hypothetical protein
MINENIAIALIVATPATLVAIGGIVIPLIQIRKHRNHEKTSDNTNAQLTVLLNGGLDARIKSAIRDALE